MFKKNLDYFSLNLIWNKSGSGEYPYQLRHNGHNLQIRVNDFPEEQFYSLLEDGVVIANFDSDAWPINWIK